jgi:hypothetical protein
MAYNKSKAKGSAFELKIAKLLTEEFGKEFRRTPLSGALEWMKGDLIVIDDTAWFPWTIECKSYAEIDWSNLLTAKSSDLHTFWQQTLRESKTMQRKPLLIFRANRSKDYVAYDDYIKVDDYVEINSFGNRFKISLLDQWLIAVKNQTNLAQK